MPRSARVYVFGTEAFVAHPILRGFWVRTHVCVLTTTCELCAAKPGSLCVSTRVRDKGEPTGQTHYLRRKTHTRNKPSAVASMLVHVGDVGRK